MINEILGIINKDYTEKYYEDIFELEEEFPIELKQTGKDVIEETYLCVVFQHIFEVMNTDTGEVNHISVIEQRSKRDEKDFGLVEAYEVKIEIVQAFKYTEI